MQLTNEEKKMMNDVEDSFHTVDFGESFRTTLRLTKDRTSVEVSIGPVLGCDVNQVWVLLSKTSFWRLRVRLEERGLTIADWELQVHPVKILFLVQAIPGGL